jgi:16S rRNA (guanine966-N2)-methyltransferase
VGSDAVKFASSTGLRFDVLFLDPPYRQGWIDRLVPLLPRITTENSVLYVESETALAGCGDWRTVRHGKAGQVFYHLMRRGEPSDAE